MLNRKSLRDGERGQTLMLFVALFTVLLGMAAFSVDQGLWLGHRRVAQKDADAAARAGAAKYIQPLAGGVSPSTAFNAASDAALKLAAANGAPAPTSAQVTFSPNNCESGSTATTCTRSDCPLQDGGTIVGAPSIEIAVRRPAPPLFLSAFGVADADDIGATSTACVGSPSEVTPGPIDVIPLMVHYDDAADSTNPAPCFNGLIPKIGQQCVIETRLTALIYPPMNGSCRGSNAPINVIESYIVTGLNSTGYKCEINDCAANFGSPYLCPPSSCAGSEHDTDCLRQRLGALGQNDVSALSNRLRCGEGESVSGVCTPTGADCWLRSQGNNALAAFQSAFERADGQPVGGPPAIGGSDPPETVYAKKPCDTGRVVLVFVTEKTHINASEDYPVLAFGIVYLLACQGDNDPPPPPSEIGWCDNVNGLGNVFLRGVPLGLIFNGSVGGDIRPPTEGASLIIQTTR